MKQQFKVLLIEDNPGDAFLIKFYLEESVVSEYELEQTEFLEEGLKKLDQNSYDVVLLDLGLPDCTDLETLERLLEHSPEELVIVLTGITDEEAGVKTVQMGAQDFLVKGQFDGKVLNSSIRYAFERFKLNQQLKEYSNELAESRRQFEETQRMANIGYWEYDCDTQKMEMTNELMELIGIKEDQFNGTIDGFLQFVAHENQQTVQEQLQSVQNHEQAYQTSIKMIANQRQEQCLLFYSKPYYDENGHFKKIVGILQKS